MDTNIAKLIGQARFEDEKLADGSTRIIVRIEEAAVEKLHQQASDAVWDYSQVHNAELLLLTYVYGQLRPRLADVLEKTGTQLAEAHARIAELEAEVKRVSEPQWFYDADDSEYAYSDIADIADNMDQVGVMRVGGAREVCKMWVAFRVLTVDDDGNADETEVAEFATEPEAAASWETSLAAARQTARAATTRHGVG